MTRMQSSALPENTHACKSLGQGCALRDVCVDGVDCGLWPNYRRALYAFGARGCVDQCGSFIHETSVTASYWLIGLHIAAALYHRYLRDGVWSAMVPIWRE